MKTGFSSVTLRYVHDVVTGEFMNIGVVLYAPEIGFLRARFSTSCERLEAMFLRIDHQHVAGLLRHMAHRFKEFEAEIRKGRISTDTDALTGIANRILPPDDSSLQWSEQGGGFTDEPEKTLSELYFRFVERYRRKVPDSQRVTTTS